MKCFLNLFKFIIRFKFILSRNVNLKIYFKKLRGIL